MSEKICVQCGTKNEEHYNYCKYCGAPLPVVDRFDNAEAKTPLSQEPTQNAQPNQIDYGGVSGEELSLYVGKNAEKIMPKFFAMQLVGKKVSWCNPVFFLGLFFGFFGMAFWFFSRKMVKIGAILAVCGLILSVADAAVNAEVNKTLFNDIVSTYETAYTQNITEYELIGFLDDAMSKYQNEVNPIFVNISSYLGSMILPVVLGLYALGFYKDKAVSDILKIKSMSAEDGLVDLRIKAVGGRSAALVIIPIILMVLSNTMVLLFL